jgi:DNA-binding transcriptional ArsR family regulator
MLNEVKSMALQETTKALADPIRRSILNLLKKGPMTAGEIEQQFEVTFASISRHLSVLKDADLIRDRREGKYIYYELNASILEEVLLWIYELKGEKHEKI